MKRRFPISPYRAGIAFVLCIVRVLASPAAQSTAGGSAANPEFEDQCVEGLAEGKHIATSCPVTWTDKDGKIYCFADESSRRLFLKDPEANLERAREFSAATDSAATANQMTHFRGEDVKAFVEERIKQTSAARAGLFPFHDSQTGQDLELVYEKVDFMRTLAGYGFFPEVVFHAKELEEKKYLIDFWVKPRKGSNNELTVIETRIYKAPKREGTQWTLVARLPTPWWWIPASEHPGKSEQTRGWEVMSAIDEYISGRRTATNGSFKVKDDKTGEELSLDLVGIHQPVRRLQENGRYFACTDFRRQGGGADEVYDLDFWVDEKSEKLTVNEVRVHKVPQKVDGNWRQVPRYNFENFKFEEVP